MRAHTPLTIARCHGLTIHSSQTRFASRYRAVVQEGSGNPEQLPMVGEAEDVMGGLLPGEGGEGTVPRRSGADDESRGSEAALSSVTLIRWTEHAVEGLRYICRYIERDSPETDPAHSFRNRQQLGGGCT